MNLHGIVIIFIIIFLIQKVNIYVYACWGEGGRVKQDIYYDSSFK